MKKLAIILATVLFPIIGHSQITLEHTYNNNSVYASKISDSSFVYHYTDSVNLHVYSSSHTLLTTIPHGVSPSFHTVYNVSQKLFDNDPGYEALIYDFVSTSFVVLDDNGSVMLSGPGSPWVYETPDGGKLIARSTIDTKVYDLPGTHQSFKTKEGDQITLDPYPNPTTAWVKLPYDLTSPSGKLLIIDLQGKVVKRYTVSPTLTYVLVQPGALPPGHYFYYVEDQERVSEAKPFIIR